MTKEEKKEEEEDVSGNYCILSLQFMLKIL